MISFLFRITILFLVITLAFGVFLTYQIEHSSNQKLFLSGKTPVSNPDGYYKGSISFSGFSWRGKMFNRTDSTGINVFDDGFGGLVQKYSFTTSFGPGSRDKSINVLKIDYNASGNPFWLRPVLDEVVETSPNSYLGKLQFRIIPGYPFSILYFTLNKNE